MLNLKMIHIYRYKTSNASIIDRSNEELLKGHEFYAKLNIEAADTLRVNHKATCRQRSTYVRGDQAIIAENYFVRGENGYDYHLIATSPENEFTAENLREMRTIISTFQTFPARRISSKRK